MPWRPSRFPEKCYAIVIGECQRNIAQPGHIRYLVAAIRGIFTINEASAYVADLLDNEGMPWYPDYFSNQRISVDTIGLSIEPPPYSHPKLRKIGWYISHYSTVHFLSEYEYNVARHDLHEFFYPHYQVNLAASRVFGDPHY